MERRYISKHIAFVLIIILLTATFSGLVAADSETTGQQPAPISSIQSGNVLFELVNLNMIPSGSSNTVSFSITITNNQSTNLLMDDYWVRVRSQSGNNFSVSLSPKDRNITRIAPKTQSTITFYSSVSASTQLSDLAIQMIYWDFSMPNYERVLGEFDLPSGYTGDVPAKGTKYYYVSDTLMQAQVTGASLSRMDQNHVVDVNLQLKNIGSTHTVIPDYQFFIQTQNNILYPLEQSGLNNQETLYPLITKDVRLKGTIPDIIDSQDWKLIIAESDGESNLIIPTASFLLPEFTSGEVISDVVEFGQTRDLDVNQTIVRTKVENFSRGKNESNYLSTVTFSFENMGQAPIVIPRYDFAIRTGDGLLYPIQPDQTDVTINPRVKKELKLSATIPVSVDESNWNLIIFAPTSEGASPLSGSIIASYQLPETTTGFLTIGSEYEYNSQDGQYILLLDSIQRLPWEDQDILTANLTVRNNADSAKPVPELTGYFLLDNTIEIPFQAIHKDNVIAIPGSSPISYSLYGKIPYTHTYSALKIVIQEKSGENAVTDIVEYTADNTIKPIANIKLNESHTIIGVGRQSEVSVRSVRTYESGEGNLFTILVDVKNLEKRFAEVANLVGHLKTSDDLIFPVNISEIKSKITPMGVATLYISSFLPGSVNTSDLELVLGEAVSNDQLSNASGADAYINPVSFTLPSESKEPKANFERLEIFPYTITMNNFNARVETVTTFSFSFNYTLNKNRFLEVSDESHQLVLEFTDSRGGIAFSHTFTLDQEGDTSSLKLGTHNLSYVEEDPAIIYKLQTLDKYKIRIYDQFMGQKKLLAEREFDWNITSN